MKPDFDLSHCQNLDFSPGLSQQRLAQFETRFDISTLKRLLCVCLFLLGAKRSRIAQALHLPADTACSLIKTVQRDGLPALEDRRRRYSSVLPPRPVQSAPFQISIHSDQQGIHVGFSANSTDSLVLPPSRPLQTKVVLLSLLEAGLLEADQIGDLLGYSTAHVRNLAAKLVESDVSALLDQRQGQQQDYRVDESAKGQIIEQFMLEMAREGKVSARTLAERLEQECQLTLPQRTVGHHMQKLGLTGIKKSLHDALQALKKTPEPELESGGRAGSGKKA